MLVRVPKICDEEKLVSAVRSGDETAFETIYNRYADTLMRYSEMILKDEDAAYETVQDTFVSVWMNRQRLDPGKPIRNYLLRAVHNNSLRAMRKEHARHMREQECADSDPVIFQPHEYDCPEYDTEGLIPAVERLPEQSRRIFRMSYWENMKSMDIASELSISVRTVEASLYKTRKRLRKELKKI